MVEQRITIPIKRVATMNQASEIPCAGSGQDAEFKTDHRIPAERFQVMTDVVLDSLTGLTWCRNANLAEFPLDWQAAHDFINEMNGERAFGRSGWRLPSRRNCSR
ncbi:MAG: DUF1566 domain-containing protein [Desulfobacterales bacterium]|nr:DUF1566 domain-containing protein [Desulfobacterales bacterium]